MGKTRADKTVQRTSHFHRRTPADHWILVFLRDSARNRQPSHNKQFAIQNFSQSARLLLAERTGLPGNVRRMVLGSLVTCRPNRRNHRRCGGCPAQRQTASADPLPGGTACRLAGNRQPRAGVLAALARHADRFRHRSAPGQCDLNVGAVANGRLRREGEQF